MKNLTLVFASLLLITSCEIPQSVTVKGNPGLYVPLGSPFPPKDGPKKKERLDYLVSSENIKSMMYSNDASDNANAELIVYEAGEDLLQALNAKYPEINPGVQTYLARYRLAEMPLELQKYVDNAMKDVNENKAFTITTVSALQSNPTYLYEGGSAGSAEDVNKPFIKIPLKNMVKLVKEARKGDGPNDIFGLEIDYDPSDPNDVKLKDRLELKIPGFGIGWMHGEPYPAGNPDRLRYYDKSTTPKSVFYPRNQNQPGETGKGPDLDGEGDLRIYARISDTFTERTLEPQIIFDWKEAKIDTKKDDGTGNYTDNYPLNNGGLSGFLGDGVSFKKVDGYMYMSGVNTSSTRMEIEILGDNNSQKIEIKRDLKPVAQPDFPPDGAVFSKSDGDILIELQDKMSLQPESGGSKRELDLRQILDPASKTLKVAMFMDEMTIKRDNAEIQEQSITFDLLVLIPMDLKVESATEAPDITVGSTNIRQNYVTLDLGGAINGSLWDGDLFGRKPGENENDYLKNIRSFKIGMFKTDINILEQGKLAILAITKSGKSQILEFKNNGSIVLDNSGDSLESPQFSVLLKKDSPGPDGPGSLRILRSDNPSFDFKLFVEARAELEFTTDFGDKK